MPAGMFHETDFQYQLSNKFSNICLNLKCMFKNGQTHIKNLAVNAARFLKSVWPYWDIMQ